MISINLKSSILNIALGYVCLLVSNFQIEYDFNERLVLFCFWKLLVSIDGHGLKKYCSRESPKPSRSE